MKKILFVIIVLFGNVFCENIAFINSDRTLYTKNEVRCNGNVVVIYYNRIISADEIVYDRKNELIRVRGNVIIKDEKQNVYFLDSLSAYRNFSSGEGKNIKIITGNQSRLAAKECFLKNGKYELKNAAYTPCYQCTDFGELTWQVKALRVIFDPEQYTEYEDAKLEIFGNPILYTPYLSHVSPKIKRKSGLLVPKFSTSSKSGLSVLPQYLLAISNSQELILKPIITSGIGNVGWAYYGFRFPNGEFNMDASITGVRSIKNQIGNDDYEKKAIEKMQNSGYRGHIFSKMKYEINDVWRCGFDINLSSDRYYLKKFPFLEQTDRILKSNIKLEGFDERNYTSIKTIIFQGENFERTPRVLPIIEYNYSINLFTGTFNLDSCFQNLDFNNHRSAQKFMSNASWSREILLLGGQLIDLKGTLSFRGLKISEKERSLYDSSFGFTPQLNCAWKWPLVLSSDLMNTIFTPIVGAIVAGNKKNTDAFEDQFCEITDLNFLDGNKSISSYNIDSGSRIYYGFQLSGYRNGENLYRFTIGRSSELTSIPPRLEATGLKRKNSNIVASTEIFLSDELTFIANTSYSPQSKRWTRNEIGLNFSEKKVCFDLMLFKGKQCFYDPFSILADSEEQKTQKYKGVMLDGGWQANRNAKLKCGIVIGNDHETLMKKSSGNGYKLARYNAGIEYKNECATVEFVVERRNYRGGDLKPETAFRFVVYLKNLGV
ncbi:MAG: LPS assembly protein LptD [Holosporaceae bacterium]|jgi:LPS-assembly protein|nr:LPS assembly protein LptD [Holosporaceae bacterium]